MQLRLVVAMYAVMTGVCWAWGADAQTEALLAKMRNAYRTVKSAKFTLESAVNSRLYASQFEYKSPMNVRADIKPIAGPPPSVPLVVVTDGTSVSRTSEGIPGFHIPFNLDTFERLLPANLESLCFYDWDRQLSTTRGKNMAQSILSIQAGQSWNGRTWLVLVEHAESYKLLCRYYVDPHTFLIWRTTVRPYGAKSDITDARIKQLQLNVPLSNDLFTVRGTSGRSGPAVRS